MDLLHFEDFPVGEVREYGDRLVSEAEIVEFARQFDPQSFHLDAEAAKDTQIGGLIASGWHTASILMRMNVDEFLGRSASQGAPGVDEVNWVRPVRPGERLKVRRTTLSKRPSESRPEIGLIDFLFEVLGPDGEVRMNQRGALFMNRREAAR